MLENGEPSALRATFFTPLLQHSIYSITGRSGFNGMAETEFRWDGVSWTLSHGRTL